MIRSFPAIQTLRTLPGSVPSRAALLTLAVLLGAAPLAGPADDSPSPSASQPPATAIDPDDSSIHFTPRPLQNQQIEYEKLLRDSVDPQRLRNWHDITSSHVHIAGTPGDAKLAQRLTDEMTSLGLSVEKYQVDAYLSYPDNALLEIVAPDHVQLPIKEKPLPEDQFTTDPDVTVGFNAYAATGDVTANVVYANYGTREDFEKLRELGVDCTGRIVIARYGGNYRGYKALFAQKAGAAGLIIYTDPADEGFRKGPVYPEGGYANETYIQRGSLLTLPYPGDPLTPGEPAHQRNQRDKIDRLDPAQVALPAIPVQPIGYGAAEKILSRMTGDPVPDGWAGGLDLTYRLTGGDDLKVRLRIEQTRKIVPIWNVIATLRGAENPRELVVIGAHYDAWSFGAGDPNSGTIAVLEAARVFAQAAADGHRPARSVMFACWGAEEFGVIGSTEWVEDYWQSLRLNCVGYINLDMASMGVQFNAGSAPLLKQVILDAARYVHAPGTRTTVFNDWLQRVNADRNEDDRLAEPILGDLGGGSDHVGFYCYAGVPSCGMSGGGSPGVSYHSNYETLAWYRKVVGDDYASSTMITQMAATAAARLANSYVIPYDITRYGPDVIRHLVDLSKRAKVTGFADEHSRYSERFPGMLLEFEPIAIAARSYTDEASLMQKLLQNSAILQHQDSRTVAEVNRRLMVLEGYWIQHAGVPGRPWYRNWYAATDEDSGYAPWMLPGLRWHVEHNDRESLNEHIAWYERVFYGMRDTIRNQREDLAM